ncbi:hypothetical protein, partial [Cutibacterium avidum]|uniref:hypothetical protein n=1 Tax=Cutibacterium avidum TaxID=33010 RepID=UPI001F3A5987
MSVIAGQRGEAATVLAVGPVLAWRSRGISTRLAWVPFIALRTRDRRISTGLAGSVLARRARGILPRSASGASLPGGITSGSSGRPGHAAARLSRGTHRPGRPRHCLAGGCGGATDPR